MLIADCNAYDLILVRNHEDDNKISISETLFRFGSILASSEAEDNNAASSKNKLKEAANDSRRLSVYLLVVSPMDGSTLRLPIRNNVIHSSSSPDDEDDENDTTATVRTTHDTAALQRLASCLRPGRNRARYLLVRDDDDDDNQHPHIVGIASLNIFLWSTDDQLVVVDVDGTVTSSTMKGFLHTGIYGDFSHTHCHRGVCAFLQSLAAAAAAPNCVRRFVYLTNRPITYADTTRQFLHQLRQPPATPPTTAAATNRSTTSDQLQHDHSILPSGPLMGYTGGLAGVFRMDLVHQNAHEFKYDTLDRYVVRPFRECLSLGGSSRVTNDDDGADNDGNDSSSSRRRPLFVAGFGNTVHDMHAYHNAGMELHRMFLIDQQSQIYCLDSSSNNGDDNDEKEEPTRDPAARSRRENHRRTEILDHPKEYAMKKGTMFAKGYEDERLLSFVLGNKEL